MSTNKTLLESGSTSNITNRSTTSIDRTSAEPLLTSPNWQGHNGKAKKHIFHAGRAHTRNSSIKSAHNKLHSDAQPESGNFKKPQRNTSTTSLKKNNNSHVSLRRNRSSAEVKPKLKSVVTFEIGEHEDGWEETSSSASPAISPSNTRRIPTAQVSKARTLAPPRSQSIMKISSIANPVVNSYSSPSSPSRNSNAKTEKNSRFITISDSKSGSSQFLFNQPTLSNVSDDIKRVQSMKNLAYRIPDEEEPSVLHSRQLGAGHSRTQQKLWLQRASSIIEPKRLVAQYGNEVGLLSGSTHEGRDRRVKNMLGRTGVQYLVVRRFQDPVGNALKRITQLPGIGRTSCVGRQSFSQGSRGHSHGRKSILSSPASQSHKNLSESHDIKHGVSSLDSATKNSNSATEDIYVLLRKLWDKSPDLSKSGD